MQIKKRRKGNGFAGFSRAHSRFGGPNFPQLAQKVVPAPSFRPHVEQNMIFQSASLPLAVAIPKGADALASWRIVPFTRIATCTVPFSPSSRTISLSVGDVESVRVTRVFWAD